MAMEMVSTKRESSLVRELLGIEEERVIREERDIKEDLNIKEDRDIKDEVKIKDDPEKIITSSHAPVIKLEDDSEYDELEEYEDSVESDEDEDLGENMVMRNGVKTFVSGGSCMSYSGHYGF